MNENYEKVSKVPREYLKKIEAGNLIGKSDINPQWRIKAMTEVYGLCGIGWKYEIVEKMFFDSNECTNGKKLIYVTVNVYIKDNDKWSDPIPGVGGDIVLKTNKNGTQLNDEAFKSATTDAIGNALKYIGVASHIYEGNYDGSKYSRDPDVLVDNSDTKNNHKNTRTEENKKALQATESLFSGKFVSIEEKVSGSLVYWQGKFKNAIGEDMVFIIKDKTIADSCNELINTDCDVNYFENEKKSKIVTLIKRRDNV